MKWLQRCLGLDEIAQNQLIIKLRQDEICKWLSQIQDMLDEQDMDKIPDAIYKLEDNIKRINQMTLEFKGVIATSRASLKDTTKKRKSKATRQE